MFSLKFVLVSAWILSLMAFRSFNPIRARSLEVKRLVLFSEMKESLMSIDELKSELEMRGVDYSDCISKNELVDRLIECRTMGKANPELLNQFKDNLERGDYEMNEIDDDVLDQAVAKDGSLPGGLSKDMMKAMSSDPQIMEMLKDPKMQEIMFAVMQGGPDAIKKYMADPDTITILEKLSGIMSKITKK